MSSQYSTYNETVTAADIQTLRVEAVAASDYAQAKVCDRAINGSKRATAECKRIIMASRSAARWAEYNAAQSA